MKIKMNPKTKILVGVLLIGILLSGIVVANTLFIKTDKGQYMVGESAIIEIYIEDPSRCNEDVLYKVTVESKDSSTETARREVHKEFQNEITLDSRGYGSDEVTLEISDELKFDRVIYVVLEVDEKRAVSTFRVRPAYDIEVECSHLVEGEYGKVRLNFTNRGDKPIRNIKVELDTFQNLKIVGTQIDLLDSLFAEKTKSIYDLKAGESKSLEWTVKALDVGYSQLRFTINSDGGSGEITHPVSIESSEEILIKATDVRIPFNKTGNVTVRVTNLVSRPVSVSLELRLHEFCLEDGIARDLEKCVELVDEPIKKVDLDASSTNTGRMASENVSWRVKGVGLCYNSYMVIIAGLRGQKMCEIYGMGNILVLQEGHGINLTIEGKKSVRKEALIFLKDPVTYSVEIENLADKPDEVEIYVYPDGGGWSCMLFDHGNVTLTSPYIVNIRGNSSYKLNLALQPYPEPDNIEDFERTNPFHVEILGISRKDRTRTSRAEAYAELVSEGGDIKVKPTRFHVDLSTKSVKEINLELTNIGRKPMENISIDIPPFHGKTITQIPEIQIETIPSLMPAESGNITIRIEASLCGPETIMSDIVISSSIYNISVPLVLDISQSPSCFLRELVPSYVYVFLIFLVLLLALILINFLFKSKSNNTLYPNREKITYFVIISIIPQMAVIIPGLDFSFSLNNFSFVLLMFISGYFFASLFDHLPLSKKKTLVLVFLFSMVSTASMDPFGPLGGVCGNEDIQTGCKCFGVETLYGNFNYQPVYCTGICQLCDLSNCYSISGQDRRDACFNGIVRASNSLDFCENLVDGERDKCIRSLARYRNSFDLCTMIVDQEIRDDCMAFIAAVRADLSLCENIDNVKGKDSCYLRVTTQHDVLDPSICGKIKTMGKKDFCYKILARILSDPSLCTKVENVTERGWCYKTRAIESADPAICNNIEDENKRIKYECFSISMTDDKFREDYDCSLIENKSYQDLCVLYTTGLQHLDQLKRYCQIYGEVDLCLNDIVRFKSKDNGVGYEDLDGTFIASCGRNPSDVLKCLELRNLTCITVC